MVVSNRKMKLRKTRWEAGFWLGKFGLVEWDTYRTGLPRFPRIRSGAKGWGCNDEEFAGDRKGRPYKHND